MPKLWNHVTQEQPPAQVAAWAEDLGVTPFLANLLWQRGLRTRGEMDRFLSPGLKHLARPDHFPGLDQAAGLLADAVLAGRRIAIWGDYDVDGVTATALLLDFLSLHGVQAMHHLPNRLEEGYGLSVEGVERLAQQGAEVLITVDCGVSDLEAVERACALGLAVLVTDHHLPGPELPRAHALCNPRVGDCTAAPDLADLAGVGVAFFLAAAAAAKLAEAGRPRVDVRPLLDMVALGTLADVVALRGQNRILAKNGLLLVAEAARPGIAALKEASGFAVGAALGAGQVTFGLAPRINAAGRMGEAETALQMLLAPDLDTARPLAARLDAMNRDRRREEERILEQALEQAAEQVAAGRLGLVLHQDDWHPGVIGIVASRVVEETYRPCLILCREGEDRLKGSGRSVREFDLHAGLTCCSDVLLGFGGHRQAAGLSLAPENLEALRERFHRTVEEALGPEPLTAGLRLDGDLPFTDIDFTLLKELELLQPFGPGNPEPVFASPPVRVGNRRVFGKNHVALELRDPDAGVTLKGKAWRQAEALGPEVVGRTMRLAFTPKIDRYNGVASIDLRIKDWNEPSH